MILEETKFRVFEKLSQDLGKTIVTFLDDENTHEIMLNPDGSLWIDHLIDGVIQVDSLTPDHSYSIINTVAGIHGLIVSKFKPQLETEFPHYKSMRRERFTAQVPPMVSGPSFTIRKKSETLFTLNDYLNSHRLTEKQREVLVNLIEARKNILICGGPGSGKTTFTNALIIEMVKIDPSQRILILEDLPELQCEAPNKVSFLTTNKITMRDLLRTTMRMRPDRILIGEVRGAEALDMLKAWNTGCPGGICTVHANGALEAIQRILDLTLEAGLTTAPFGLVEHTIDAVVSVAREKHQKGFIQQIIKVGNYKNAKFEFEILA